MMTSNELRQLFLDFFKSKQHTIVPSAPMVLKDDPTLMFINAGMAQFKDIFLDASQATDLRVADSQKCLRVSGKHNDLEEVGHDTYHHTMFEMLGNWSFGDYFKKEAIEWAWEFLTEVLKIDKSRLYATVFGGDKKDNTQADEEAKEYWKNYLPEDRILYGNKKDNFWEMGDTGPCGPCSEIHIDLRSDEEIAKVPGHEMVNKDHPLVIEIWNLVFIQYNRKKDGNLVTLPQKHVDTGMGFERLCCVVQGKKSNYDIDLFKTIIASVAKLTNKSYGKDEKSDIAMRVVADHLRTVAFSIADGQMPSNTGAGYVIRRILRRAIRYGYTFLNMKQPFIYKLLPSLIEAMSEAYPELKKNEKLISQIIEKEESTFLKTLETGIDMLEDLVKNAKAKNKTQISGVKVFKLYDSYGFPYDLTELMLKEQGMTIGKAEFDQEMQKQKKRSQKASSKDVDDWQIIFESSENEFVGYDFSETEIHITRYRTVKAQNKTLYHLVFDKTPFYAESGGQVGDMGFIYNDTEKIKIIDTQKEHNVILHITEKLPQNLDKAYKAEINNHKREMTKNNHSATHLMHHALREVLGNHVEQKGSYVDDLRLRFDFSHFQKMTDEEIKKVENLVNKNIRKNWALEEKRAVGMSEAKEMGALAFFGEKYGNKVRVIKFGNSVELCGGTHVQATGNIGAFKIIEETSVAAGIRRIEAVTAEEAENYIDKELAELGSVRSLFKNSRDLKTKVEKTLEENKNLKKQIEIFEKEQALQLKNNLKNSITEINGIPALAKQVKVQDAGQLKDLVFMLKGELKTHFIALGAEIKGKANLMIAVSKDLTETKNIDAGKIIREAAKEMRGGGGGQAHFASAGGSNPQGIQSALDKAVGFLQ